MLEITNLGHACFLLKEEQLSVVIDPYRDGSVPGLKMPRIEANYVLCSHNHYDHDAANLINLIPSNNELNVKKIVVAHDHHNGAHRGLNTMFLIDIGGYHVLHTGDLGHIPNPEVIEQIKGVDIMLAPINGHFTISANELFEIMRLVQPKITIPMHYYRKENNSGYPDGGQIDIFKSLVKSYYELNEYTLDINGSIFENKVVIFNKAKQE